MTQLGLWHYDVPCQCSGSLPGEIDSDWHCICDNDERMVRARINGEDIPDLLPDERASLAFEAETCSKGGYRYVELLQLSDQELCECVLISWIDMARKHGLI